MATSYLDADAAGGGDGTLLTPWNSLTTAETNKASWDILKVKRGTVENLADAGGDPRFIFANGDADKTVTTYYNADGTDDTTQAKPILDFYHTSVTGDWTEVSAADPTVPDAGSNLWVLDGGSSTFNPIAGVWFGSGFIPGQFRVEYWTGGTFTETDVIPANAPAQDYQFDWLQGHATLGNNLLIVYSVGNPVTYYGAVYWAGTRYEKVFVILNSDRIVIENIHFRYVGYAGDVDVSVDSTTKEDNVYRGCTLTKCANGFTLKGAVATSRLHTGTIIEDCDFTDIINSPVSCWGGTRDAEIRNNTFTSCGLGASTAACYSYQATQAGGTKIRIHGNIFSDCKHGRYWPFDGGCVETDNGSHDVYIYNNYMTTSAKAYKDNSGLENYFYGNLIIDCDQVFQSSDAASNNGNKLHIYNNTATGLTVNGSYDDGTGTAVAAMQYSSMTVLSGSEIYNNTLVGVSAAAALRRYDAQAGNITEDYNCFDGFTKDIIDENDNEETIGSNSLSTDPLVNADGSLQSTSPCVGVGVKWWGTSSRPVGYDGEPFPDWDIDIGGSQSLFSPFHPVNL